MMQKQIVAGMRILMAAGLVASCGDPGTGPDTSANRTSVAFDVDSLVTTVGGQIRANVHVVRDSQLLYVEDTTAAATFSVTGPFTAAWDTKNTRYYRVLNVTPTDAGDGRVIVSVGGRADTLRVKAVTLDFKSISVADGFACGLSTDDRAWCWGGNDFGQLGAYTVGDCVGGACQYGGRNRALSPVPVSTTATFSLIVVSGRQCVPGFSGYESCGRTCAITSAGAVSCWSVNPSLPANDWIAIDLSTDQFSGFGRVCGLATGGGVFCESSASFSNGQSMMPASGAPPFQSISVTSTHGCGLTTAGAAYCWGSNSRGNLGIGTVDTSRHLAPEPVSGAIVFSQIAVKDNSTCGLATSGTIYCWGANYSSSGTNPPTSCPGTVLCQATPAAVQGGQTYVAISTSKTTGTMCGLTSAGAVNCWKSFNVDPTTVNLPQPLRSISVGSQDVNGYFTPTGCGVSADNVGWCWSSSAVWKVGR